MGIFSKKRSNDYGGWCNRETWLTSAWINNDEMFYQVLVQACRINGSEIDQAAWLDRQVYSLMIRQVDCSGLFEDLVQGVYARIDWVEIIREHKG